MRQTTLSEPEDRVRALFRSFPFKVRAKKILEWYEKHPGEWEKHHPEASRSKARKR